MKRNVLKSIVNKLVLISIVVFTFVACEGCSSSSSSDDEEPPIIPEPPVTAQPSFDKVASIINQSPQSDYVMVLSHRGGFINTPENSLSAIEHSTNIGVDIVEIDVQLTKDNVLVVMHDKTINRTTNGTGSVSDYTMDELRQFKLLMPNGAVSDEVIPSLQEVLVFSKDKMHLFIDKGDDYLVKIYEGLVETNTLNQTIIGGLLNWTEFNISYSEIADNRFNYIPRVGVGQSLDYINKFKDEIDPVSYFVSCGLIASNNEVFGRIKERNKWIIATSLVGSNCSEENNPESIWNWEVNQGVDGIFTDKSQELINYLNSSGLHNNE